MIVYERNQWEPVERYYFRSSNGTQPICELTRKGDGWEVLFYRGATHPGPHPYDDFAHAKAHIMRYLVPREAELMGDRAPWTEQGNISHLALGDESRAVVTRHRRRAKRRGGP